MRSFKTRVRIETRTDWADFVTMDLHDHWRELRYDAVRRYVLWRYHPRAVLANYAGAARRCFIPYQANSHVRKAVLLCLTLVFITVLAIRTYITLVTRSFTGVLDIPFIVLSFVWAATFMFEMGQEVDSLSIADIASIDFVTDSDTDADTGSDSDDYS